MPRWWLRFLSISERNAKAIFRKAMLWTWIFGIGTDVYILGRSVGARSHQIIIRSINRNQLSVDKDNHKSKQIFLALRWQRKYDDLTKQINIGLLQGHLSVVPQFCIDCALRNKLITGCSTSNVLLNVALSVKITALLSWSRPYRSVSQRLKYWMQQQA